MFGGIAFCHDATLDEPDTAKLIDKLFRLLIDFACIRQELADALANVKKGGSASGQAFLAQKARRLFVSAPTTGEVGELLLYYLAEHALRYPQVLCKFPLKTNPNVHAHGADEKNPHPSIPRPAIFASIGAKRSYTAILAKLLTIASYH